MFLRLVAGLYIVAAVIGVLIAFSPSQQESVYNAMQLGGGLLLTLWAVTRCAELIALDDIRELLRKLARADET